MQVVAGRWYNYLVNELAVSLKRTRRVHGDISQKELAAIVGCSQQLVGKWETGTTVPGSRFISPLARFLGIDEAEVLRMAFTGTENRDEIEIELSRQRDAIDRLEMQMAQLRDILGLLAEEDTEDDPV